MTLPSSRKPESAVLRRLRATGAGPRPVILLRPRVDLDLAAEPRLRAELARHLADSRLRAGCVIVLHLGGRFVDGRGLLVLVETAERARRLGSTLAVVAPSAELVRMTQLLRGVSLPLFDSVVSLTRMLRTGTAA